MAAWKLANLEGTGVVRESFPQMRLKLAQIKLLAGSNRGWMIQ
jgi:hypothetical protein